MNRDLKGERILIATNNKNKQEEIKYYFKNKDIKLLFLTDFNQEFQEPKEDANTFLGNAYIKAKYYSNLTGYPALSDDSGLCVNDLDGLPGIYSSRWAGEAQDYNHAITKIAKELTNKHINKQINKAKFVCSLVLFWDNNHYVDYYGEISGNLNLNAKGINGFGYDPFFIPDGHDKTFAEMSNEEKRKLSHRSIAFKRLLNHYF